MSENVKILAGQFGAFSRETLEHNYLSTVFQTPYPLGIILSLKIFMFKIFKLTKEQFASQRKKCQFLNKTYPTHDVNV